MAEHTLNSQLSGDEIIEAVIDKLRAAMRKDCYLNKNSAYDWFNATVTVQLNMHDTGNLIKGDYTAQTQHGVSPANGEDIQEVTAGFDIDAQSPNEVRVATGQPVPTLTKDATGKTVVKGVSYARKDVRKATAAS